MVSYESVSLAEVPEMCGIVGYRELRGAGSKWSIELPSALSALSHRGPDDQGSWIGDHGSVGLGHRRLSILDLSPHGHQPMQSACGRWLMVFNGEIYNFESIRAELTPLGYTFKGTGDSEVILAAFSHWGPDAVKRFIGMFAIALWHQPTQSLHLIRDRLGVKPLYYYWDGQRLFFGSELKAVRAFSGWTSEIDRESLCDYLRYGYINAPRSIYKHVACLPPAHRIELHSTGEIRQQQYWNVLESAGRRGRDNEAGLEEELEALMVSSFKYRMISDVPVGVFLSGGVDSSAVAAILQKHGGQRLKTFTIGFDDPAFDESGHAADVAHHLGTEHHCRVLRVADAKRLLPRWGELYDEPFGDESGIPTLMVSEFAAEHVKVVLSADGGDELFSGYNTYTSKLKHWRRVQGLPQGLRAFSAAAIDGLAIPEVDDLLGSRVGMSSSRVRLGMSRLSRIGMLLPAQSIGDLSERAQMHFHPAELAQLIGYSARTRVSADVYPGDEGEKLCLWDLHNYLPGDILTKVDRATMAVSIEGREPFLDHRLVEFAFSLPFALRRGPLGGKHILKKILYKHVPRHLVDRPKRGFGVPVKHWLAGDLSHLVSEYLDPSVLVPQGLFNVEMVQGYVKRLRAGDVGVRQRVWLLVAFQMWCQRWMPVPR